MFIGIFELISIILISVFVMVPCCRHKKRKYKIIKSRPEVLLKVNSSETDEMTNEIDDAEESTTEGSTKTAILSVPKNFMVEQTCLKDDNCYSSSNGQNNYQNSACFNVSPANTPEPLPFGDVGFFPCLAYLKDGTGKLYEMHASIVDAPVKFTCSGNCTETMVDSVENAKEYVKKNQTKLNLTYPPNDKEVKIKITPAWDEKDGYSATCAAAVAIISLLKNKPAARGFTFIGDLIDNGRVKQAGCPPSKLQAAKSRGITHIILAKAMESEVSAIADNEKIGLEFIYLEWFQEAMEILFDEKVF